MIEPSMNNNIDKYSDILDLFCCNPVLCNNYSYDKNGFCLNCIQTNNFNKTKKELFLEKKDILGNSIKDLLAECEKTIGKINKVGVVLKLFENIYYNIFFLIIHPKFLITVINKINEFNNNDNICFTEYINENKDKEYIYNFMNFVKNFVKINNYDLDLEMKQEKYDNFLNHFVNHMKIYYENIINQNKQEIIQENTQENIQEFDINSIEKYVFCLDI